MQHSLSACNGSPSRHLRGEREGDLYDTAACDYTVPVTLAAGWSVPPAHPLTVIPAGRFYEQFMCAPDGGKPLVITGGSVCSLQQSFLRHLGTHQLVHDLPLSFTCRWHSRLAGPAAVAGPGLPSSSCWCTDSAS